MIQKEGSARVNQNEDECRVEQGKLFIPLGLHPDNDPTTAGEAHLSRR